MKSNASFSFILFLLFFSFSKPEFISIKITRESDPNQMKLIGPKGTFALMSETNSPILSYLLEGNESEKFEVNFRNNEGVIYTWLCSLWIPEKMNVLIKCQIDENASKGSSLLFTLEKGRVKFGEINIKISSADDYYFELDMKEFNVPFIYSEPQIIDLDENKDSYILRFKADSFLKEKLAIVEKGSKSPFAEFDDLVINNNELICEISRKKIEEILKNKFELSLIFFNEGSPFLLDLNSIIKVKYTKPKQEVIIMMTKYSNEFPENDGLITFNTTITKIEPLTTDSFNIEISPSRDNNYTKCFLKKYDDIKKPLLLLCENTKDNYFYPIKQKIYLEQIHFRYNFLIFINNFQVAKIHINEKNIGD